MKSYFNFSKSQKIGVLVVLCIIFMQIIWLKSEARLSFVDPFVVDDSEYLSVQSHYENHQPKSKEQHLTNFNPNILTIPEWVKIGFSTKQAKSIVSFKNKIGGFKSKEDLEKVYVISESKYNELKPYILIENNSPNSKIKTLNNKAKNDTIVEERIQIDINIATLAELINIKGIGEYTAKGIIGYRALLGGFHSKEQLLEVNGVSEENFGKIKANIIVSSDKISLLNVNQLSIPQLKKHPYLTWTIAEAITRKRLLSDLENLQFLVDQGLLSEKDLNKLAPYIKY